MFYLVDGKFPNGVVTAEVANHDYFVDIYDDRDVTVERISWARLRALLYQGGIRIVGTENFPRVTRCVNSVKYFDPTNSMGMLVVREIHVYYDKNTGKSFVRTLCQLMLQGKSALTALKKLVDARLLIAWDNKPFDYNNIGMHLSSTGLFSYAVWLGGYPDEKNYGRLDICYNDKVDILVTEINTNQCMRMRLEAPTFLPVRNRDRYRMESAGLQTDWCKWGMPVTTAQLWNDIRLRGYYPLYRI